MPKYKLTPQEKKKLAYTQDHRIAGSSESVRAWRQTKRVKKRYAVRRARRAAKVAVVKVETQEAPDQTATRRFVTIQQKSLGRQWGVMPLSQFARRSANRRKEA